MLEMTVVFSLSEDEYWTVRNAIQELLDRPIRTISREI